MGQNFQEHNESKLVRVNDYTRFGWSSLPSKPFIPVKRMTRQFKEPQTSLMMLKVKKVIKQNINRFLAIYLELAKLQVLTHRNVYIRRQVLTSNCWHWKQEKAIERAYSSAKMCFFPPDATSVSFLTADSDKIDEWTTVLNWAINYYTSRNLKTRKKILTSRREKVCL